MITTLPSHQPKTAQRFHPGRRLAAATAAVALFATPALAEPPMWVIEDEDSTIYLFGTVHLLTDDIEWRTDRVEDALDEATELWLEVAMPEDMAQLQMEMAPLMLQHGLSPGVPLSSRLTEEEQEQLARAVARTPNPAEIGMTVELMKPWVATVILGMGPLMNMGYDPEAGADVILAGLAHEQGDEVLGLETAEQQLMFFASVPEEEQMEALRRMLAVTDEEFEAELAAGDAAFRAWAEGDASLLEDMIALWATGEDIGATPMPYETLLTNRNADWAGQIEELLAGEGVTFIAVGAGHLLGPDSVQNQLAERGIDARAY